MTSEPNNKSAQIPFAFTILVASLGYFVDLFDITLYGVVRLSSLSDLGTTDPSELLSQGVYVYNAQMLGLMIGGLIWGRMADRRGRVSVLFASIVLYSLANLANALVTGVQGYAFCRFVCGIGLAGELGAAVTLLSELLPTTKRGLGTTIVATVGMSGVIAAALFGHLISAGFISWRLSYVFGGGLGLLLLLTRMNIKESIVFRPCNAPLKAFLSIKRLKTYVACILAGAPIYFVTGVIFTFAPELTRGLGIEGVAAGDAILYGSIGLTLGDFLSGVLSQALRSRKIAIATMLVAGFLLTSVYFFFSPSTATAIYWLTFAIGLTSGYWAVLVTTSAEQFGTDLRGTVATSVPNFVRGTGLVATTAFLILKQHWASGPAAWTIALACFCLALLSLWSLDETFQRDLNYRELN